MITSSTISSGTATSGKVLTANGSGGCSWETAGGGTTLYEHNIRIQFTNGMCVIKIINSTSTAYTSFYSVGSILSSYHLLGYSVILATGYYNGDYIWGVQTGDNTYKMYIATASGTMTQVQPSGVYDSVITIS